MRADYYLWLVLAACGAAAAQAQTAREVFYSAGPGMAARPPGAGPKTAAKPRPGAPVIEVRPGTATVGPPRAPEALQAGPLGLRYSILKEAGAGRAVEVDTETIFRSGDRIRLTVETNDNAYLYMVHRGSSGNWSLLFPSPEIAGGDNLVEKGRQYEIPAGHWFAFDEQAGEERLFIVLCRQAEGDLEKLIYALQQESDGAPALDKNSGRTVLAQNRPPIDDAVVERVRARVLARDLLFERVDEKTPGNRKETAVYVVNAAGGAGARVVADVTLKHQ
jgi:hypothetical protein